MYLQKMQKVGKFENLVLGIPSGVKMTHFQLKNTAFSDSFCLN